MELNDADTALLRSPERHQKANNRKPPITNHHFGINPNQAKRSQGSILLISNKDREASESSIWIPLNRDPKNQKVRLSDNVQDIEETHESNHFEYSISQELFEHIDKLSPQSFNVEELVEGISKSDIRMPSSDKEQTLETTEDSLLEDLT